MDKITPQQRSHNMSLIRGKDTKPELLVRKYLFAQGLRFRKNDKRLSGHPDVVLPKYRAVIFVNGCFWHGHEGCRYYTIPKSNTDFWVSKVQNNRIRDQRVQQELSSQGWKVITVWECELKKADAEETLHRIFSQITG